MSAFIDIQCMTILFCFSRVLRFSQRCYFLFLLCWRKYRFVFALLRTWLVCCYGICLGCACYCFSMSVALILSRYIFSTAPPGCWLSYWGFLMQWFTCWWCSLTEKIIWAQSFFSSLLEASLDSLLINHFTSILCFTIFRWFCVFLLGGQVCPF